MQLSNEEIKQLDEVKDLVQKCSDKVEDMLYKNIRDSIYKDIDEKLKIIGANYDSLHEAFHNFIKVSTNRDEKIKNSLHVLEKALLSFGEVTKECEDNFKKIENVLHAIDLRIKKLEK